MTHNNYVYILVVAVVTYLIRVLPLTLIRREIKNRFLRSFLYYVPYVTLELDLKKWEKIQCYGKHDSWPGKAVDAFVKRWIEEVVKPAQRAKTA